MVGGGGGGNVVVVVFVVVVVVTNPDRAKQVTLTISKPKLMSENNNMIGIDTSSSAVAADVPSSGRGLLMGLSS